MSTMLKFLAGLALFLVASTGIRYLLGGSELVLVAYWQAFAFYAGFRLAGVVW